MNSRNPTVPIWSIPTNYNQRTSHRCPHWTRRVAIPPYSSGQFPPEVWKGTADTDLLVLSQSHRTHLVNSHSWRCSLRVSPRSPRRNPTVLIWSIPTNGKGYGTLPQRNGLQKSQSHRRHLVNSHKPHRHPHPRDRDLRRRNPTVLIWSRRAWCPPRAAQAAIALLTSVVKEQASPGRRCPAL